MPIRTIALEFNDQFLSSIDFNGQIFKEIGPNREKSRDKVAAVVLYDVFEICFEHWKDYLWNRTSEEDVRKCKENKEKTFTTELEVLRTNARGSYTGPTS